MLKTGLNLGYGNSYGKTYVRNICFTPPTLVDTNNDGQGDTWVPGPVGTDPCLPTSPDYVETVTASGLPCWITMGAMMSLPWVVRRRRMAGERSAMPNS